MYWGRDKLRHLQCCPGEAINDQPSAISHVWVEYDIQQCVAHLQQARHSQRLRAHQAAANPPACD